MPTADHRNRSRDLIRAWFTSGGSPLASSSRPVSNLQLPRPKFGSLELPQSKFGECMLCDRDPIRIVKAMASTRRLAAIFLADLHWNLEAYLLSCWLVRSWCIRTIECIFLSNNPQVSWAPILTITMALYSESKVVWARNNILLRMQRAKSNVIGRFPSHLQLPCALSKRRLGLTIIS